MEEKRYIISETSAKTGLEAHVLRYWEEELGLVIPRNELGHRYYTDEHIALFCKIKAMKDKGYQLKAIKAELAEEGISCEKAEIGEIRQTGMTAAADKMEQFKAIIGGIVTEALRENNVIMQDELSYKVSDKVIKEMDYLLRMKEDAEEERYKRLDETIRNCQKSNKEAAAGSEERGRRKKRKHFGL